MLKRALFCATVASHIKAFHLPYIKWFKDNGWEVDIATNGQEILPFADKQYHIPIERSPFKANNLKAYRELKKLINENRYRIVHCHTPMGGVLTRLAARQLRKDGTKVMYTAHGFHFFRGASFANWILYYPVEKLLSRLTDVLITINEEDYIRVVQRRFKAREIMKVNGVGIDLTRFHPVSPEQKAELRQQYGISQNDFVLIYCAEFIARKNHELLIEVMLRLTDHIPNVKLLLAGEGQLETECKNKANQLGLLDNVMFLGFCKEMENVYALSDVVVSASTQEGLPVHIMEALASGLPAVVTDVRGNRDLVSDGVQGFVVPLDNIDLFAERITQLYNDEDLRQNFSQNGKASVEKYAIDKVLEEMKLIYRI